MRDYFLSQSWYKPMYSNVIDRLSQLEKNNIELIKQYEGYQEEMENSYNR